MKKITIELNQFKKLGRMCDFGLANRDRFVKGTPAARALTEMISTINNLNTLTASLASLENRLRELSRSKSEARATLSADVEFLYHTARAIASESPGFDDKFRLPLKSNAKLLNAARSAATDAALLSEIFIKHAMPHDFLRELNAHIRNFEKASDEYANGKTACAAGAKALKTSLRAARSAANRFDAIMRNTLRGDPATLEAWKRAFRLERATRPKGPDKQSGPEDPRLALPPSMAARSGNPQHLIAATLKFIRNCVDGYASTGLQCSAARPCWNYPLSSKTTFSWVRISQPWIRAG